MTSITREPIYIIINADDYGYFSCVSKGISDAARQGGITATGILANGPDIELQIEWLRSCENLDLGVHLNLTTRQPLTALMASKLYRSKGLFPNAFTVSRLILTGKIDIETVRAEWRTQIETCLKQGVVLTFLNSHEHIHMLPVLFQLTRELAEEYKIPYVRLTQAEWGSSLGMPPLIRNILMPSMYSINQRHVNDSQPKCLGLDKSGKLDLDYLSRVFAKLNPGKAYELMCHPGYFDPNEITDPKLLAYHAWEQELDLLNSSELKSLYRKFNIRPINYRTVLKKRAHTR
ncbi:MAG: ChbG/HpnK family deacetylase [Chlorobiales bacterium]|nr:ChbG/HpnK family deacetylase [Chlorobiales bacterium]